MLSRGAYGGSSRGQSYVRITTPNNLELALEGLVRKVLQEQPKQEDIYSFAADYFETLLDIRDKAELPNQKVEEICPNHSEFEAQSLIKLATSFPKPAFLAAASSAIATEEMCRVVDIDEIKAREDNNVIDLTHITETEENEGTHSDSENQELEAEEAENAEKEENSDILNDDNDMDKQTEDLEDKLESGESINTEEIKIKQEGDNGAVENESGKVGEEPQSESGEVIEDDAEGKELEGEIKDTANDSVAGGATENGEQLEDKQSDIPEENSVINDDETDLRNDEPVLPIEEEDKTPEKEGTLDGDNKNENIPKNDKDETIEPIALETTPLKNVENPSDVFIKSESCETNETEPVEDAERDIIKEFIDREKDYCTMGNSTRSIEIAEIHDVDVEEGIPINEEEAIQEATAKELMVENSGLIGGVTLNNSSSKVEESLAVAAAAGGIIGGFTLAASNNESEKVDLVEEQAESLLSIADLEESEKTDIIENTRKKRDTEAQDIDVADSEINAEEGAVQETGADEQEDVLDGPSVESDDNKAIDSTKPEISVTADGEGLTNNSEETSSLEKQIIEDSVQKSDSESDIGTASVPENEQDSEIVEAVNETEDEVNIELKKENVVTDNEDKQLNDAENEVSENIDEDKKGVEEEKVSSAEEITENELENLIVDTEKREEKHVMGEEIKDEIIGEPSLETIEEEEKMDAIENKVETPEISESKNDVDENPPSEMSDSNRDSNSEPNKNDDNEPNNSVIDGETNSRPQDEVPNKSEPTTSPVVETFSSEEVDPVNFNTADSTTDGQISKEAEAVVSDVIEKATENAIKISSLTAEPKELSSEDTVPPEPEMEIKEEKTELENLPKKENTSETMKKISNESENSHSRSSKDSESLEDENPFISAEVKSLVVDQGSAEETEEVEDEEDKIVPLNADINPIEEKDEGQWAAQMGLVTAALTIQKTFRRYLQRKKNALKVEDQPIEVIAENEVQEEIIKSQSSALNESMSTDSSLSSSATKIQQSEPTSLKLTRRNTAVENPTAHSFAEEDVKERTKSFSISHRVRDSEVWSTLEHELESAATTIQNSYKNYRNRQRLRREDAVQITTTASEDSSGSPKREGLQGTGELHDVIVPEEYEGK